MRTTAPSRLRPHLAGVSLAISQLLLSAARADDQAPAPPPTSPAPAPAVATSEKWTYGFATRVGDARPWLEEMTGTRYWINPEYLLWGVRRESLPGPFVTTGGPADPNAGVPGSPTTAVLFDGHDLRYGAINGGRLSAGVSPDGSPYGVDANVFFLEKKHNHFDIQSDALGNPLIAIPVNLFGMGVTAIHVAEPNTISGGVHIDSTISLWGAEANAARTWIVVDQCAAVNLFAGIRFLEMNEAFKMSTNSHDINSGDNFSSFDSFGARNRFVGFQVGADVAWRWDHISLGAFNKLAVGSTEARIEVNGMRTGLTIAGNSVPSAGFLATTSTAGGVLTSPSNIGTFNRDHLAVVDEIGVNANFEICEGVAVTAGFSFLFWSDVARAGDQISTIVAPVGVTPPANAVFPAPNNHITDFWAYGANLGLEFRY